MPRSTDAGRTDVVIAGAGTLGTILYDCLLGDERWNLLGFIDDHVPASELFGLPVHRSTACPWPAGTRALAAVADPAGRRRFVRHLAPLGLHWATFTDRRSHVSPLAAVGPGSLVLQFAAVGPLTTVGAFGYVGAYAAAGDGAVLGEYASLMARASAGDCRIGDLCLVGFNSACMAGASLGNGSIVAPYTFVRKPFPAGCIVAGNPARIVRRLEQFPA